MSGRKNTVENSVPEATRPGRNGGTLRAAGKKGNKGGSGRPPNEFRERMQELASGAKVEAYLKKCLRGEFGPKFFLQALNYVTERGYGKAPQPITGEDGGPIQMEDLTLSDEERAARLTALLAQAQARKEAAR